MRSPGVAILLCLSAAACSAQTELTPETLLLARIKVHMAENLAKLPNFTCTQTIERFRRPAPSHRLELVDTLRLEVAFVDRKEMFAWPGAGRFDDRKLVDMTPSGAIGDGSFALHARSVLLSGAATYTYIGEEMRGGRRTTRYDYRVPLMHSGYQIRVAPHEAKVAYQGSLWADASSLDLVRLEVRSNEIPPELGLLEVSDAIEYGRVRIGESDFLLPRSSELRMVELSGGESRNRTVFSGCRQFTGESFLSFDEAPPAAAQPPRPQISEIVLPEGMVLELYLETEIDSRKSFVGDPVTARLGRDARKDHAIVVPKGAVATGRITRMERRTAPYPHYLVGLQFFSLEFGNTRASFQASLEETGRIFAGIAMSSRQRIVAGPRMFKDGTFTVAGGDRVQLPRGFHTIWRTESPAVEEKK